MLEDPLYEALFNLLEQKQWREADIETYQLMLGLCDRTDEGWLRQEDILDCPCVELRTIDRLWLHFSNQKFGFSIQKRIYEQIKETIEEGEEIKQKLGNKLGWCVNDKWLSYPELTFHLAAPFGHLPRYVSLHIGLTLNSNSEDFWGKYLFSRMTFCDENPDQWMDSLIIDDEEE
jgi:hypothetical protein